MISACRSNAGIAEVAPPQGATHLDLSSSLAAELVGGRWVLLGGAFG
jgi:hypothetical protein